jgi:type I restriction enzyme M protein
MVETRTHTKLPQLISSILSDGKRINVAHNDPLRNPHYVEGGQLKTFNTTIALLPFGVNVSTEIVEHDLFNRFSEKTRSMTVLALRHILAQTKGRAIMTAINSLLFSSGAERSLREDLLNKQQIEAVVAMPAGLLDATAIPFSILILNTEKRCDTVRFVNADTPQFKEETSRTKSRLINVEKLIETILTGSDSDIVKNVSTQEILANDSQLQVNRYALGATEQNVARILASLESRRLDDIATLVKPVANITNDNGTSIYEVGASDIPDYGYIHTARKQMRIELKADKMRDQFLRPNDIVLIIKGTLGKIGIISDDVPPPGENGWIAGQSAAVIRVEKSSDIDPCALFMLLRSELGKELVKTLASGSAIPFVQLRELKQLAIPIPTPQDSINAITALTEEEALQHQINELQRLQALLSANCWSLKNNEKIGY